MSIEEERTPADGTASRDDLVRLRDLAPWLARPGGAWLARLAERALGLRVINRIHRGTTAIEDPVDYLRGVLAGFGVRYEATAEQLARIPPEGPVVVVANHPFGGLDAIVLCAVLAGLRRDARVLANHLLQRIPQVAAVTIPVDPFGGAAAARRNVRGMQLASEHLEQGGLLGMFPSGTVSHFSWRRMAVEDPEWSAHVSRLVRRARATVVPIFFPGRNSLSFQAAGLLHPLLRTALIPREAVRRKGTTVTFRVGRPIPFTRLERFEDAGRLTRFLRIQTHVLGGERQVADVGSTVRERAPGVPIACHENVDTLRAEVASLPGSALLVREGSFSVYLFAADQAPSLLREVGCLREETFRAAGEGTGKERDLDGFDSYYSHLVLWDDAAGRIAGGYRLARVDRVLRERGPSGIYTATLFRFRPRFLEELGPALELGRSWIRLEYQRKHNALALLWRGIAGVVVREPEACVLLGPVSISRDYQPLSRGLIVSFLKHALGDGALTEAVRALRPFKLRGRDARLADEAGETLRSIDDVSLLVSEIESDGKGVPMLFRHYLRLHSVVLSFNVDPEFADVVDGLLLTDLRRTDPKILSRFMGADGLARFRAFHGSVRAAPSTRD
jgi:putative hemolysin